MDRIPPVAVSDISRCVSIACCLREYTMLHSPGQSLNRLTHDSSLISCDACPACRACVVCLVQGYDSVAPCAALSFERLAALLQALHHPWRRGGASVRRVPGSARLLRPPPNDTSQQNQPG